MTEAEKEKRLIELRANMDRVAREQREATPWAVDATVDSAHDAGVAFMRGNVSLGRGIYDVSKFAASNIVGPYTGQVAASLLGYGASRAAKALGASDDTVDSIRNFPDRVDAEINSVFDTADAYWQYKTPWMKESPRLQKTAEFVLPMALSMGTYSANAPTVTRAADLVTVPVKGTFASGKTMWTGGTKIAEKLAGSSGYTGTTIADLRGVSRTVKGGKSAHWFGSAGDVRVARARVSELERTLPEASARTAEQAEALKLAKDTLSAEVKAYQRTRFVRHVDTEKFLERGIRKTRFSKDAGPLSRATVRGAKRGFLQGVGNSGETYAARKERLDAEADAARSAYRTSLDTLKGTVLARGPRASSDNLVSDYRLAKEDIKAFRESKDPDPLGTRAKDAAAQEAALLKAAMSHPKYAETITNQVDTVFIPKALGFSPGQNYTPGMDLGGVVPKSSLKKFEQFRLNALSNTNLTDRILMEDR